MPDEVPPLVQEFLIWLRKALTSTRSHEPPGHETAAGALEVQLTLACDAHTRLVFVHPFADGNGRLARTLGGLVLQRVGLPAPMFTRGARTEYMATVSAATIDRRSAPLSRSDCALHDSSLGGRG